MSYNSLGTKPIYSLGFKKIKWMAYFYLLDKKTKKKKSLRAKCTYCPNHIHIKYSRPQMEVARWQKRILRGKVTRERCRRERPLCLHGGCKGLGTGTPNVDHTACHKELLTELTSPSSNCSTGGCNFLYISHGGQAWKLKCSSLPGH